MARVVWKRDKVISIKVRDDLYVLAQMLESPYLVFFDAFSDDDNWAGIDLGDTPVLFYRGVTRQLLSHTQVATQPGVAPAAALDAPTRWLQVGPGSQALTIWDGTPDQMTVMTLGEEGLRVIEKDISQQGFRSNPVVSPWLTGPNHEELETHELDTLGVYPETIERLALCHLFGRNVDPDKDLIAGRSLPLEYKAYYEAIS